MATSNINNISDEMIDQMLGSAKTQDDLFGADGIVKQISKRFMERLLPPRSRKGVKKWQCLTNVV